MSRWTSALVLQLHPLVVLGFRQLAIPLLAVELLEPRGVGMDRDQRVEDVEGDIDRFAIAQVPLAVGVLARATRRRCTR